MRKIVFLVMFIPVILLTWRSNSFAKEPDNKLCFVQFIHPGGEHKPDSGMIRTWNTGSHLRKFVINSGASLSSLSDTPVKGDLVFWGEWEPPAEAVKQYEKADKGSPRWLFKPYFEKFVKVKPQRTNTDPFIYGNNFLYGNCQQNTKKGPTQMRALEKGSVILFGSGLDRDKFVVDTVFVVSDYIDYDESNYTTVLKGKVPEEYFDVTLYSIFQDTAPAAPKDDDETLGRSFRLYLGATYEKPYNGMFSFFPCLQASDNKNFKRPAVYNPDIITDNLTQGKRLNPQGNIDDVKEMWTDIAAQVIKQGLRLGVQTDIPRPLK